MVSSRTSVSLRASAWTIGLCILTACQGTAGTGPTSGTGSDDDKVPNAGVGGAPAKTGAAFAAADVRRLSPTEINNSISDVLLAGASFEVAFKKDWGKGDFDNQYQGANVTLSFAEDIQIVAESAALAFGERLGVALPCSATVTPASEAACVDKLLNEYIKRLYRRPLTDQDRQSLRTVFEDVRKVTDFKPALLTVVAAAVQGPSFLFRSELGTPDRDGVRLTSLEIASALSYFIWRSAPDDELLDSATAGKLSSTAQIQTAAKRMLADPKSHRSVRDFFAQWLGVEQLKEGLERSDPLFTDALRAAMFDEAMRYVEDVVWNRDGSLKTLLTSTDTFANASLATIYGVAGPKGQNAEKIGVNKQTRSGFLTQPGFLATHNPSLGTSPIFIGKLIRTNLLCQKPPNPPDNIPPQSVDPTKSTRERLAMHSSSPSCLGCHNLIEPLGYGLERFDNLGRERASEKVGSRQVPLSGEGELIETDVDGKFTGAVELATRLASSKQVQSCFSSQWLKFMTGRETTRSELRLASDEETLSNLDADGVQDLIVALVGTESFYRRAAQP